MAKWIADARSAAEQGSDSEEDDEEPGAVSVVQICITKATTATLSDLFGTTPKRVNRVPTSVITEEEQQIEALANALEDVNEEPDNGAIEVPSEGESVP